MRALLWMIAAGLLAGCATSALPPPPLPADHNGPPMLPPANAKIDPNAISAERMSEVTRVLASDDFQGRSMGGVGEEKTVLCGLPCGLLGRDRRELGRDDIDADVRARGRVNQDLAAR